MCRVGWGGAQVRDSSPQPCPVQPGGQVVQFSFILINSAFRTDTKLYHGKTQPYL
jgi:hypothetical protein